MVPVDAGKLANGSAYNVRISTWNTELISLDGTSLRNNRMEKQIHRTEKQIHVANPNWYVQSS